MKSACHKGIMTFRYVSLCLILQCIVSLIGCAKLQPQEVITATGPSESLRGTWETTELDASDQIDFAGAEKVRLVILARDDMYLFTIYPDGEVCRCHDAGHGTTIEDEMIFGPFGSCLLFKWQIKEGKLHWTKKNATRPTCIFTRIGEPDDKIAETWMKFPDSYSRFKKYFRR